MPCFSDITSDLWAMQKRYPNSNVGRLFASTDDDDEEEVGVGKNEEEIKSDKIKMKYKKGKKQIVKEVEEEEEEEEEEEQQQHEGEEEEEEETQRETYDSREDEPEVEIAPVKVTKTYVPKADDGKIKKGKPDKVDRDVDESESLTKPVKTVSTKEHHIVVDEPKPHEDLVQIRQTDKRATVEPVIQKRDQEQAEIKQKTKQVKPEQETQSPPPQRTGKAKSQIPDEVKKRDDVSPSTSKSDTKPTHDVHKSSHKVPKADSITASPLPTVSAGHIKKPTTKLHPTVEELIEEDDKNSEEKPRCNNIERIAM